MKINIDYTKKFLALSILIGVLILSLKYFIQPPVLNQYVWYIYLYVIAIMYISHMIIAYGFNKSAFDAHNFFLLGTSLKLLVTAAVIFIYFYVVKIEAKSFLIDFFVLYFVYSFFEIKTLLLSLQPHSKNDNDQ